MRFQHHLPNRDAQTQTLSNSGISICHLTSERVPDDDNRLEVWEQRRVSVVLQHLIQNCIGRYSSLLIRILIDGARGPCSPRPH